MACYGAGAATAGVALGVLFGPPFGGIVYVPLSYHAPLSCHAPLVAMHHSYHALPVSYHALIVTMLPRRFHALVVTVAP